MSMTRTLLCRCHATAEELRAADVAERSGLPYLLYRDHAPERCRQHIVVLNPARDRITVGRTAGADIALETDAEVSRAHCVLERWGDEWSVIDHNLSRNGSFVNEERVSGSRALAHGDVLRVGGTILAFHVPGIAPAIPTVPASSGSGIAVSEAQRRVLEALCAPFQSRDAIESTPTNRELAQQLYLSEVTVKAHLRALYAAFEVEDLPRTKRRAGLVKQAFRTGVVRRSSSAQR